MSAKVKEKVRVSSYPQHACTISPQREFSRVLPSTASFLFSPVDFYRVSLRENHGFCLQWLYPLHFPKGFIPCLFQREPWTLPSATLHFHFPIGFISCLFERESRILPSMVFHFHFPSEFLPCLFKENFHGFLPQWILCIFIPSGYRVSSERTFMGFTFSGFSFILNPQQFCPPKDPFHFDKS